MSKKTLNKANLEKLGADKLAALVMELVRNLTWQRQEATVHLLALMNFLKSVARDSSSKKIVCS
jgi:hypothetical protein